MSENESITFIPPPCWQQPEGLVLSHSPVVGNMFLISEVFRDCDTHLQSQSLKDVFEGCDTQQSVHFKQSALVFWGEAGFKIFVVKNLTEFICENELVLCQVIVRAATVGKTIGISLQDITSTSNITRWTPRPFRLHQSASCCHLITFPLGWPLHHCYYDLSRWILALHQCLLLTPCSDSYFLHHKKKTGCQCFVES